MEKTIDCLGRGQPSFRTFGRPYARAIYISFCEIAKWFGVFSGRHGTGACLALHFMYMGHTFNW